MIRGALENLRRGFSRLRDNPQLLYTALTAAVILAAFIYTASRFVNIAEDAQERLVNVRVGSIHDAFVPFVAANIYDVGFLSDKIAEVALQNETIRTFRVVLFQDGAPLIVSSLNRSEEGTVDERYVTHYRLAATQPLSSFTREELEGDERFFVTVRAVADESGDVIGAVLTRQTLSEADRKISWSIRSSIAALFVILAVVMLLFFRHSRIIDYTVLYRKLKEVDDLKDDIISMASHELRSPLTAIMGYADFVRESPRLGDEEKGNAENIIIAARRLDKLVADLLDVSKLERGEVSFTIAPLDAREVVGETVQSLRPEAVTKGLALSTDLGSVPATILADRERLREVITNLVSNSVKYTLRGDVKLSVCVLPTHVLIECRDTGVGISAEDQKRLFSKFFRAKSEEVRDVPGTGLGLWITAEIVHRMRGTIAVESIRGTGTRFTVTFPLERGTSPQTS